MLQCGIHGVALAGPDGGAAQPGATSRARFEAALAWTARDEARAAVELEEVAEGDQQGEYAAEALAEAAQLLEERLGRPDRARDLYARIVARYPDSRPSLRARSRLAFLDENLATGAEPLGEYQRILNRFAGRPPAESRRMMAELVARHPDFALADRALLWLATLDAREGREAEAEARFAEVERRFAGRESAALARKGRADARLRAGHPFAAREIYRSLVGGAVPWPAVVAGAKAGEAACGSAIRREAAFFCAVAWLVVYLVGLLRMGQPLRPLRLGAELAYYLPVAGLFVAAGLTESRPIAVATGIMATGGAGIVFACGRAVERLIERGRMRGGVAVGIAVATVVSVFALGYAALHKTRLVDFVVETARSGPDR